MKTNQLFAPNVRMQPVKTETTWKLDYTWWSGLKTADTVLPRFITIAEGSASFLKGNYQLSTTWDDAVRIYVDNKMVIDEWNPAVYQFDESPNKKIRLPLEGNHSLRVEHLNLGGLGVLTVKLTPVY